MNKGEVTFAYQSGNKSGYMSPFKGLALQGGGLPELRWYQRSRSSGKPHY